MQEKIKDFENKGGFAWLAHTTKDSMQIKIYFEKNAAQFERTPDSNTVYLDYDLFADYTDKNQVCTEAQYKGLCIRLAQWNLGNELFWETRVKGTPLERKFSKQVFVTDDVKREQCIKILSHYEVSQKGLVNGQEYRTQRLSLYKEQPDGRPALLLKEIKLSTDQIDELRRIYKEYQRDDIKDTHDFEEMDSLIFDDLYNHGIERLLTDMDLEDEIDVAVRVMA